MYTRLLIPLDGSKTAEAVLPYGRTLAGTLKIPVELLGVIDMVCWPPRYPMVALDISKPSSPTALEAVRSI